MPRLSRLVVPGTPHHIAQRGVRSLENFADDRNRSGYSQPLAEGSARFGVTFMGWCLMTNPVHLRTVPEREKSLARAIGETHRRYTRRRTLLLACRLFVSRTIWLMCTGQQHLLAAGRYLERNPVAAKMVEKPQGYHWSR